MDSTDAQGGSAESLLYIFPAPIFSPPQRNRPSHGNGQSATALWPIVAESRVGFHGRDPLLFQLSCIVVNSFDDSGTSPFFL